MTSPAPQTLHDPSLIPTTLPDRIGDVLKPWTEYSSGHPALVEASGAWTYGQLSSAVDRARAWLGDSGVRPGDRVMIVCENCRALVALVMALSGLDAWPVLVNARLSAREVDEIREHCGARLTIYTTAVSPHAANHAKRCSAIIADPADLGTIGVGPSNEAVEPEALDPVVSNRVAVVIYTSGTTGQPKGVLLTHRGVLYMATVSARIRKLSPGDRVLCVLPISHAVGFSVVLLGGLVSGVRLYLAPRFDPAAVLKSMEKDGLTIVLGAPAMFSLLVEYANLKGLKSLRFPNLRIISSSGAPLPPALKSSVETLFGMPLYNGYGVTECSPTVAQACVEDPRKDTSVGRIFPGIETKLIGKDGQPVPDGEVGELWVKGPTVMKGYYRASDETAAAISPEGWFNTRDLAQLKDGNLFIVGRTKDLIVRFGFNVYPAEIEAVLNSHPAIVRSAVIGRPVQGDQGGEEVVAFIQPRPDCPVTIEELTEFAAQRLASYKRPNRILSVPSMPLTLTGKVIKDELAKTFGETQASSS